MKSFQRVACLSQTLNASLTGNMCTVVVQAVSIHCADWAFKVIKHAHGGHSHVTVSTLAGVKAKTAGDVVRHFKQGHTHGVEHVLCRPWIRYTCKAWHKVHGSQALPKHIVSAVSIVQIQQPPQMLLLPKVVRVNCEDLCSCYVSTTQAGNSHNSA